MKARRTIRGQPLVVLVMILTGWIGARTMIVETSSASAREPTVLSLVGSRAGINATAKMNPDRQPAGLEARIVHTAAPLPQVVPLVPGGAAASPVASPVPIEPAVVPVSAVPAPQPVENTEPPRVILEPTPVRVAAGHQLLWMAAMAQLPLPAGLQERVAAAAPAVRNPPESPIAIASRTGPKRWSADGWLLWREGGSGLAASGPLPPTYGASQTGAVIRYRLDPQSPLRPTLYLRATTALSAPHGEEAAFGIAARPLADLPVAVLLETRVTRFPTATRVRPAILAVTELPAFDLPINLRGETYLQAGYVAGSAATAFIDGSARIDRRIASLGQGEVRIGGGVWGGAQRGAARLDMGPSATFGLPLGGPASTRIAVDWRLRVAGDAAPQSGPAVTLSAGF